MNTLLGRIIEDRKREIESEKKAVHIDELKDKAAAAEPARGFARALGKPGPNVIAELKKASPTRGLLRPDFDVEQLARVYAENGAAALSVLTERNFFSGDISYIARARRVCDIPVLRKDFIIDEYQVVEARAAGADAVLLIVAALEDGELAALLGLAHEYSLDALVEVHDGEELERALAHDCDVIGVNNRNLKTGDVDIKTSLDLAPGLKGAGCKISESGIKDASHVKLLMEAGYNGFLVGETLVVEKDPGPRLRELAARE